MASAETRNFFTNTKSKTKSLNSCTRSTCDPNANERSTPRRMVWCARAKRATSRVMVMRLAILLLYKCEEIYIMLRRRTEERLSCFTRQYAEATKFSAQRTLDDHVRVANNHGIYDVLIQSNGPGRNFTERFS